MPDRGALLTGGHADLGARDLQLGDRETHALEGDAGAGVLARVDAHGGEPSWHMCIVHGVPK